LRVFIPNLITSLRGNKERANKLLIDLYQSLCIDNSGNFYYSGKELFARCLESFNNAHLLVPADYEVFNMTLAGTTGGIHNGFLGFFNSSNFFTTDIINARTESIFSQVTSEVSHKLTLYNSRKRDEIMQRIIKNHHDDKNFDSFVRELVKDYLCPSSLNIKSRKYESIKANVMRAIEKLDGIDLSKIQGIFLREDNVILQFQNREIKIDKSGDVKQRGIHKGLFGFTHHERWTDLEPTTLIIPDQDDISKISEMSDASFDAAISKAKNESAKQEVDQSDVDLSEVDLSE
jgi:hypothetical protein